MKIISRMIVAAMAVTVFASAARAQGLGVRAGASVDPDQFYGGVHFETRELAEHLRFRPNVEVGVGDDVTLVAFNFEFTYRLPPAALPRSLSMWHLYVGGGPALNIVDSSDDTRSEGASTGWSARPSQRPVRGSQVRRAQESDLQVAVGYVPSVKQPRQPAMTPRPLAADRLSVEPSRARSTTRALRDFVVSFVVEGCAGSSADHDRTEAARRRDRRSPRRLPRQITLGTAPTEKTVAADPAVLPLGARIRLTGLDKRYNGVYVVRDTGGNIRGHRIDLYMRDCHEAVKFGRRPARVAVLR
jgi:3D (Asp-Asp-Asp) domain-containing protein